MIDTEKKQKQIANRIRAARENAGLSQGQAAKQLDVARPTISECEAGRRRVTAVELTAMAKLYGVSVAWLACEHDETADPDHDRIELAAREIAGLKDDDLASVLQLVRSIRARGKH
ncbi:helix-turn-helix domain-containing protein [Sorangium sp. So ce1182]|uniref:helix-turn-helix domain-containing protein n=1 Tax=Sorangium sp. So ce1182 TaxID=3133334 RepID=UPI003F5FD16E